MSYTYDPNDAIRQLFSPLSDFPGFARRYDLRLRVYNAMARFWISIGIAISTREQAKQKEEVENAIKTFRSGLKETFELFDDGERYNHLNWGELWSHDILRHMHRTFLRQGDKARNIQIALDNLWDDFFMLTGGEDGQHELEGLLTYFEAQVLGAIITADEGVSADAPSVPDSRRESEVELIIHSRAGRKRAETTKSTSRSISPKKPSSRKSSSK